MSTQSWSTRVRHDSDATYQEWRDEFITKLNALVAAGDLAADETDITPAAGARPGSNTEGGYAVYHLDDALHASAPVYLRFGFGTHSTATAPRITVTVGTSTNGSGVLGGTALSALTLANSNGAQVTDTARQSYMSGNDGWFGVHWKTGINSCATFWFCRSCDNAGVPTATGGIANWGADVGDVGAHGFRQRQAFRFATTAAAYTATTSGPPGMLGFSPQQPISSAFEGNLQVFLGWMITPLASPIFGACGVYLGELAAGGTFQATLVGSTARTYISLASGGRWDAVPVLNTAMLWE